MNPADKVLPVHADHELQTLSPAALIDLLVQDEDRAPRNLIDECARRGADMVDALSARLTDDGFWDWEVDSGDWWLRLHAVMILGRIPDESAGLLLVAAMRQMDLADDEDLQDWCAGKWPAFVRNKPDSVLPALREICTDRRLDCYIRVNAVDPVVAAAKRQGGAALNDTLAWVADLAADESDDWEFRLYAADVLLDFPRARHRPLLEAFASEQAWPHLHFDAENIESAFAAGKDQPGWERFDDPWDFYAPESIAARQQHWAEEERKEREREAARLAYEASKVGTVKRTKPKIGRNDPCPCGSGKKYKKCCLYKGAA